MDAKEAYIEKAKAQIKEIEARMNALRVEVEKATADTKSEMGKRLEELNAHRKVAEERLQQLQRVSGDAWTDLREGMEKALSDLKEAANKAKTRFE
jgi:predicted secreted Zn-dependent protease